MSAVNGKNGLRPGVGIHTPLYIIILLEKTCAFNTFFAAYFKCQKTSYNFINTPVTRPFHDEYNLTKKKVS